MNKININRFQELHLKEQRIKFPSFPDFARPPANCKESGANDLTRLVVSWINLNGYQSERISTTGRILDGTKIVSDVLGRKRTIGSAKYIPGTSTKGSADVSSTIQGISVKIEVKWQKDTQSEHQKTYQNAVQKAGGIYYIAQTFDDFVIWYDDLILKLTAQHKLF
jgi:hypothetical protein